MIRRAQPEDMAAVYALRREVFVVGQGVPEDMERDGHDAGCEHAVALLAGQVVGTGRLLGPEATGTPPQVATVGRLAVTADRRASGIGAAVLATLERRAVERGFREVELHAQVHARPFYDRAGYRAVGQTYLEAGIEHVTMRKDLPRG